MNQLSKKRLRFTDHDDLTLLREVLGQNPIENPQVWAIIQENMLSVTKKNFTVRTLREHLDILIKSWLKELKNLKNLSGIEVTQTEKDTLCENIYALICAREKERNVKRNNLLSKKLGLEARDKFASSNDYAEEYESSKDASVLDFQDVSFIEEELESVPIATDQEISLEEHNYFCKKKNYEDIENAREDGNSNEVDLMSSQCSKTFFEKKLPKDLAECSVVGTSLNTPKPSRILGPLRSRKRKINTQRQGLAYLEAYDRNQNEQKKKRTGFRRKEISFRRKKDSPCRKTTCSNRV